MNLLNKQKILFCRTALLISMVLQCTSCTLPSASHCVSKVHTTMAEIKDKKLLVDGYIYVQSRQGNGKIYWDCRRVRSRECRARAITNEPAPGQVIVLLKGPQESKHSHLPNREQVKAVALTAGLKRKATTDPGMPPAQILPKVSTGVLSQMPEREALTKAMQRARRKHLPPNPRALSQMAEVPQQFTRTLLGERFLIYDSRELDEVR